MVKLQPYRQHFVAQRYSHKLDKRYFGTFIVLKKVGQVAYQLQLPSDVKIHDVFCVSLLKPFYGDISTQFLPLPPEIINSHSILEPFTVLQSRQLHRHNFVIDRVSTVARSINIRG